MPKPERGTSRLRNHRLSEPGAFYFLTTSTNERKPILAREDVFNVLADSMEWMQQSDYWIWICFIAMPDHFHLIVKLGNIRALGQVMNSFKGFTGKKIKQLLELDHDLWQKQYFERYIRDEEELRKTIEYCYGNPVRKGMVTDPALYPYWRLAGSFNRESSHPEGCSHQK